MNLRVSPPQHVKIEVAYATDPGRDPNKQVNEDAVGYAATPLGHLCVLCDGMGGHQGGREASHTAVATVLECVQRAPDHLGPAEALRLAVEEAGRRVYAIGGDGQDRARPGSTLVAMLLHDRGLDVAHVGDSRAYAIRAKQIYPLTRDHSMVQGMIDAGILTEAQAIGHPDSNKITRALGMRPEVEVELRPEPMELFAGDLLLLTSDGLTDLALGPDILGATMQALAHGGLEHACHELIRFANERGGHDNITVLLTRVVEPGPKVAHTIPGAPRAQPSGPGVASPTAGPSPTGFPTAGSSWPGEGERNAAPPASRHGYEIASPATLHEREHGMDTIPVSRRPHSAASQVPPTQPQVPPTWLPAQGPGPTVTDGPASARAYPPAGPYGPAGYAPPSQRVPAGPPAGASPGPTLGAAPGPTLGGAVPTAPGSSPAHPAHAGQAGYAVQPAAFGAPVHPTAPAESASRGGIVYVVVGLSSLIAALLILLLWALFAR